MTVRGAGGFLFSADAVEQPANLIDPRAGREASESFGRSEDLILGSAFLIILQAGAGSEPTPSTESQTGN